MTYHQQGFLIGIHSLAWINNAEQVGILISVTFGYQIWSLDRKGGGEVHAQLLSTLQMQFNDYKAPMQTEANLLA